MRTNFDDFHELAEELPHTQPRSTRAELPGYASSSGPWGNTLRSPPLQRNDRQGARSPAPSMQSSTMNTPLDTLSGFHTFHEGEDEQGRTGTGPTTPEPRGQSFEPVESSQFLPAYVIDNFVKKNPDQDGFFCVFQKTYLLKSDGRTRHEGFLPSNQTSLWVPDQVIGHVFEVTLWGSLIYHGPFQDNEKDFVRYWGKRATIKELGDPMLESNSFLHVPNYVMGNSSGNFIVLESLPELHSKSENAVYSCEAVGLVRKPFDANLEVFLAKSLVGSWKRIYNLPGEKSSPQLTPFQGHNLNTTLLYTNFPRLVARILSSGKCQPQFIHKFLSRQKDEVCARLNTPHRPEDPPAEYIYPAINLRIPPIKWKDEGWMYTEPADMDVLVS
ncbi:hypothetical protein TWF694_007481 [Orbilia ellipsospora]|uniref:Uncharacterized protein n=1 Tax=Orbilia ellipsospora TaxID=2528407 RepID=A0AAV9XHW5_9PEZI